MLPTKAHNRAIDGHHRQGKPRQQAASPGLRSPALKKREGVRSKCGANSKEHFLSLQTARATHVPSAEMMNEAAALHLIALVIPLE